MELTIPKNVKNNDSISIITISKMKWMYVFRERILGISAPMETYFKRKSCN